MPLHLRSTVGRSLFLLWGSHLLLDFFTGIWPLYKTIAGIDLAKAGLIGGLSGFLGEITQLCFGYLSDRGHRKKMLMIGLLLGSSILWITFTDSILVSFFVLLLLTLGSSAFHPSAAGLAGFLSEQKGRNILFFASGGAIGLGVSQLAFSKALHHHDGHALVFLVPLVLVLAIIAIYPMQEQKKNQQISFREFIRPILKTRGPLVLLYLIQIFNYTLIVALMFLLPDLMRSKGCHSWLCMGGGHLCLVIGGAVLMIPAGYACDKFGHKRVLLTIVALATTLLFIFLAQPSHPLQMTALFLIAIGAFTGSINPIIVSWGNKLVPESPSTVSGLLMGGAWCIGNLGAIWAGLLTKVFTSDPIPTTLGVLSCLLICAFVVILFVPQVKPVQEPTVE